MLAVMVGLQGCDDGGGGVSSGSVEQETNCGDVQKRGGHTHTHTRTGCGQEGYDGSLLIDYLPPLLPSFLPSVFRLLC